MVLTSSSSLGGGGRSKTLVRWNASESGQEQLQQLTLETLFAVKTPTSSTSSSSSSSSKNENVGFSITGDTEFTLIHQPGDNNHTTSSTSSHPVSAAFISTKLVIDTHSSHADSSDLPVDAPSLLIDNECCRNNDGRDIFIHVDVVRYLHSSSSVSHLLDILDHTVYRQIADLVHRYKVGSLQKHWGKNVNINIFLYASRIPDGFIVSFITKSLMYLFFFRPLYPSLSGQVQ